MVTGDAVVDLVVEQDAFLAEPAPPGSSWLLVEYRGLDGHCADLYRREMHCAFDSVEVGLFLLGTTPLDIADPDRRGNEDKRCEQGNDARREADLQASSLWQGKRR